MTRICANCGRKTSAKEQMYTIRIEMFARVEPLVFEAQELQEDQTSTLHKLIEEMEQLDPQEAADQIHESYAFDLCGKCRSRIHLGLKMKKNSMEPSA